MKIAYVLVEELHPGLQNKIYGQTKAWEVAGHDVVFVSHKTGRVFLRNGENLMVDPVLSGRDHGVLVHRNRLARLNLLKKQYSFLKEALETLKPDVSYGRYPFPYWGIRDAYGAGQPVVFEINTNDLTEYYLKHRTTGIYNRLLRKAVLGKAAGLVFVTRELASAKAFRWYTGARLVMGNGVDVSVFPFVEETRNLQPNLCFIGSQNQKWHGLEKAGLIAEALPGCQVHIIGPTLEQYVALGARVVANLTFHGYLDDQEAKALVANMDVGISTLSLYEKSMFEACPLKARQYLAQGIPFLGGYEDTDIAEMPFYLQLPNTPDNVAGSLEAIREFVNRAFGNRELRVKARHFAEKILDVRQKEALRLDFLAKIAGHA